MNETVMKSAVSPKPGRKVADLVGSTTGRSWRLVEYDGNPVLEYRGDDDALGGERWLGWTSLDDTDHLQRGLRREGFVVLAKFALEQAKRKDATLLRSMLASLGDMLRKLAEGCDAPYTLTRLGEHGFKQLAMLLGDVLCASGFGADVNTPEGTLEVELRTLVERVGLVIQLLAESREPENQGPLGFGPASISYEETMRQYDQGSLLDVVADLQRMMNTGAFPPTSRAGRGARRPCSPRASAWTRKAPALPGW